MKMNKAVISSVCLVTMLLFGDGGTVVLSSKIAIWYFTTIDRSHYQDICVKRSRQRKSIGLSIMDSMTREQIAFLLDSLFGLLDAETIKSLLTAVPDEMAVALSQILDPNKFISNHELTDSKYKEKWETIWDNWYDCVDELGNEDGKYVEQEHHWEAPYFDGYALSEDLEKISAEMLPLLEGVRSLGIESDDFFEEALEDIEERISDYPDWMGAEHSDCTLGPTTTACILRWLWLVADSSEQPAAQLLDRVGAIQDVLKTIDLDHDAFAGFFASLLKDIQKQLYEHIRANKDTPRWQERLNSSYSEWHRVYQSFSESFDSEEYLEQCRRHLPEDWTLGLPLVESLLDENNYEGAEDLIRQTFTCLLRLKENQNWVPEDTLLVEKLLYSSQEQKRRVLRLLKDWILAAEKTDNQERAAILSLQQAMLKGPYQLDSIVESYNRLSPTSDRHIAVKLMGQWMDFIARGSVASLLINQNMLSDTWIHWLIETEIDEGKGAGCFSERIRNWLGSLSKNPQALKAQEDLILTLTEDVTHVGLLGRRFPRLLALVARDRYLNRECAFSRRKWLKNMQVERISTMLSVFWKEHIIDFVPDPSAACSSDYSEHADWLLAVEELNPKTCFEIIGEWKITHTRRRNLWKALKRAGLSV